MSVPDCHALRLARFETDQLLAFLLSSRAGGEAIAGPTGLSKKARRLERKLTTALQDGWVDAADDAVEKAASLVIGGTGGMTEDELQVVLDTVEQRMGAGFAADVMPGVRDTLTDTYRLSRAFFTPSAGGDPRAVSFNLTDQRAVNWLENDSRFWVGSAYSRQLGEQISSGAASLMLEGGLGRKEAGRELKKMLSGELLDEKVVGKAGYFEGLAAVAATRARSFGSIEGFVEAEISRFEYLAIMDERTSKTCRELNGRIFDVRAAVAVRDAILESDDPEAVRDLMPWKQPADIANKASSALAEEGVMMPPAHFRCRSTVVAVDEEDLTPVTRTSPARASQRTLDAVDALTEEEHGNKLATLRANPRAVQFDGKAAERHAKRHGGSAQFAGQYAKTADYVSAAQRVVQQSTDIFVVGDRNGGRVHYFVDSAKREIATLFDSGELLAFNGASELSEKEWTNYLRNLRRRAVRVGLEG